MVVNPRRPLVLPLYLKVAGGKRVPGMSGSTDLPESARSPSQVRLLMDDFGGLVNDGLRESLATGAASRGTISRVARTHRRETSHALDRARRR
jgi:hypothetical protein